MRARDVPAARGGRLDGAARLERAEQLPRLKEKRRHSAAYDHRGKCQESDASDIGSGSPMAFEAGVEMLGTEQQRPKQVGCNQRGDHQRHGCEDAH